ncbi:hypothetical protein H072_11494 [Dactylellina haptotyla CBS 200.50]|uniref:F-box domain-containing protein n=1 Tax=Dactylellina haptotyla (strain CBS 200.50) TaxID=1284197 RepID=S8BIR2_DACHA|nr:hypothetical protein H072_11494 [Dactylellina haptotyla CBS 200.50]
MPHAIEPKLQFEDLPRELLEEILNLMPTKSLVIASRTSKYIHDIATYIISRRLRHALHVEGYRLVFECYEAADMYNHPYNNCEYTGTYIGTESSAPAAKLNSLPPFDGEKEEFNPLPKLYTRYTPTPFDASCQNGISNSPASSTVTIDSGDLFTQVCASASLVKLGSMIPVFESFFRVRREWLDRACEGGDDNIVWVGMGEDVGLELNVSGKRISGPAIHGGVRGREEDPAVQYHVDYESLVIRATYLLEMIEQKKPASFYQSISLVSQPEEAPMPTMDTSLVVF